MKGSKKATKTIATNAATPAAAADARSSAAVEESREHEALSEVFTCPMTAVLLTTRSTPAAVCSVMLTVLANSPLAVLAVLVRRSRSQLETRRRLREAVERLVRGVACARACSRHRCGGRARLDPISPRVAHARTARTHAAFLSSISSR